MEKHNLTGQIHNAMYQNIQKKGYVAPVDVLMGIGVLAEKDYENWRFGRIPFLEKVCKVNLHRLSEIMREVRKYASKNSLKPSFTVYHQWGKHNTSLLRFSKYENEKVERQYATHYVDLQRIAALKKQKEEPESL